MFSGVCGNLLRIVMKKEALYTAVLFALILLLAACPSPSGDETPVTFSITIGYEGGSMSWDATPIEELVHMIRVVPGPNPRHPFSTITNIKADQTVEVTVVSGRAEVFVRAKDGSGAEKAVGYMRIWPGSNDTFNVEMKPPSGGGASQTPVADDFDIRNMAQEAGSNVKPVTVTHKAGKSSGARTVYYQGTDGTTYNKSITMPTAAGTYAVTFDVAATPGWTAATGLSAGTLALVPSSNVIKVAKAANPSTNTYEWNEFDSFFSAITGGTYLINIIEDIDNASFPTDGTLYTATGIDVFINGNDKTITLSGANTGSLLRVKLTQTVTMYNLTLKGHNGNSAPLVFIEGGTFNMNSGAITGNNAGYGSEGGGVYVMTNGNGIFNMNGGTISHNTTINSGGGVMVGANCTFNMNGGTISNNTAGYRGGGVFVYINVEFNMSGGTISGNTAASSNGGGVYNSGGIFTMTGGTIGADNTANEGGGVYVDGGFFTMTGGTISGNEANNGGGVNVVGGSLFTMDNGASVFGNKASGNGGGVFVDGGGIFNMSGGTISRNEAANDAGGVYLTNSTFEMTGGTISGNTAAYGGGVNVNVSATFNMSGSGTNVPTISGNTVSPLISFTAEGGGVYVNYGGTFNMNGGTISGNTATDYGGGVYNGGGTFHIVTGTVYGSDASPSSLRNTAGDGAAFYGTAQYGTFVGNVWTQTPDINNGVLTTTDDTLRVVNGVLQP